MVVLARSSEMLVTAGGTEIVVCGQKTWKCCAMLHHFVGIDSEIPQNLIKFVDAATVIIIIGERYVCLANSRDLESALIID